MAELIACYGRCTLGNNSTPPFETLVGAIISQQLSNKAASTIAARVRALVGDFSPQAFLATTPAALRSAGLSGAKSRYLLEMSRRVATQTFNFTTLKSLSNDGAIEQLISLPGIGRWSAQMFLIFGLHRLDVIAVQDAGLQRAFRELYGRRRKFERTAQKWQPYASVGSWYLWQYLDHPKKLTDEHRPPPFCQRNPQPLKP